ncbi:hypothetical protein Nepgr_001364 [Nepenthes gracilis]|uniref:Gag-Pol polyprotein/retrotransposon n=1 Tax=Nepenthes gracilis TaxID=150966 RepID=A0AAD3RXP8_NEPGR|nr:hypothetical protein Nepgr_001364 [Nepenthes gracilis]
MSSSPRIPFIQFSLSLHYLECDGCGTRSTIRFSTPFHLHHLNKKNSTFSTPFPFRQKKIPDVYNGHHRDHSGSVDNSAQGISDAKNGPAANHEGVEERNENQQRRSLTSTEVLKQLRRYGISGILSYGLLNTVYYLTTFLLVWFYFAPAPGRMGYFAAVQRFLKVMAMVWAGSEVTKLIRAAGALALAPFVDRGLSWFTVRFKFESQGKAFLAIVSCCLGIAVLLFLFVTLLWA